MVDTSKLSTEQLRKSIGITLTGDSPEQVQDIGGNSFTQKRQLTNDYHGPFETEQRRLAMQPEPVDENAEPLPTITVNDASGSFTVEDRPEGPVITSRDGQVFDTAVPVPEGFEMPLTDPETMVDQTFDEVDVGLAEGADPLTSIRAIINAPIRGIKEGGMNLLDLIGAMDHEDIKQNLAEMDKVMGFEDLPEGAEIARDVISTGAQLIGPATGIFKALTATGKVAPLAATIISEAATGAAFLSPEEENLFNLAADNIDHPLTQALGDLFGTDTENPEGLNRFNNAVEALAALGLGEVAIRGLVKAAKSVHDVVRFLKKKFDEGIPVGLSIKDVSEAAPKPSVTFSKEITDNNVRLHSQRLEKTRENGTPYPGAPKNKRIVIKAPSKDLPDFVVGDITPEDWIARTEKLMSAEDIVDAANWYDSVRGHFLDVVDGDPVKASRLMGGWLAAQQNESPANAMGNVLFMWEQLSRGVAISDVKGKGLPSANKAALAILSGEDITGGVGQKIADFIDAGEGRDVRSIMGGEDVGGAPFVVDIHTARDTGLVDDVLKNHLKRLGYKVPKSVVTDVGGGGIKGPMYENRAMFGRELTDHLNSINWQGRSNWKPKEIQAIGWVGLTRLYGDSGVGGDVVSSFSRNVRRISMEAAPGEGSPAAVKYGDRFENLPSSKQREISFDLTQRAIDKVNERLGMNIGSTVHATGGWQRFTNPSTVQQAISSKDTAQKAANLLGYYLQQTEVWVNASKAMTKNPKGYSIDIIEKGSRTIRESDEELSNLWQKALEADDSDLIQGYQPIEDMDGNVGIRILVDKGGKKAEAAIDKWQTVFAGKRSELEYDVDIELTEAEIFKARNDWTENPDGQGYLQKDHEGQGIAPAQDGTNLDLDRQELEDEFGSLIDAAEAEGRTVPTAIAGGAAITGAAEADELDEDVQVASLTSRAARVLARGKGEAIITPDELSSLRQALESGEPGRVFDDFDIAVFDEVSDFDAVFDALTEMYGRGIAKQKTGVADIGIAAINEEMNAIEAARVKIIDDVGMDPAARDQALIDLATRQGELNEIAVAAERAAKGGTQTNALTTYMADVTGMTPDRLINRRTGQAFNAVELQAAKAMVKGSLKKMRDLHKAALANPTDEAILAVRRSSIVTGAMLLQFRGAVGEAGRALQILRRNAPTPLGRAVETNELIALGGGSETNRRFMDAVTDLLLEGDDAIIGGFSRKTVNATTTDMLFEAWVNSLLGSPKTQALNMTSNAMLSALLAGEKWTAATIGAIERGLLGVEGGITYREAWAHNIGGLSAIIEGIQLSGRAFMKGQGSDTFQKVDLGVRPSITSENLNQTKLFQAISPELLKQGGDFARVVDVLGDWYYRLPSRFLTAGDEFFKVLAYRAEVNALAARRVMDKGLTGAAAKAEIDMIKMDPEVHAPDIHIASTDAARYATLTTPPGPAAEAFNDFRRKLRLGGEPNDPATGFPIGRVIMPFFNVINNITKMGGQRIPFLAGMGEETKRMMKYGTAAERQTAIARQVTGAATLAAGAYMAMNGGITGRISDDRRMVKSANDLGIQEYSVFLPWLGDNGEYVSFRGTEPVGMFLAISADTATALSYVKNPEEREALVTAAMAAVAPYMMEQSFFTGLSQAFDALSPSFAKGEGRIDAMGRFLGNYIATAPGALLGPLAPGTPLNSAIRRTMDEKKRVKLPDPTQSPEYRIWDRVIQQIFDRTPGLSKDLPALHNWLGKESQYSALGPDIVSRFYNKAPSFNSEKLKKAGLPEQVWKMNDWVGLLIGRDMTVKQYKTLISEVGIEGEMMRLGKPPSEAFARIEGIKLNGAMREEAKFIRGKGIQLRGDMSVAKIEDINGEIITPPTPFPLGSGEGQFGLDANKTYNLEQVLEAFILSDSYIQASEYTEGSMGPTRTKIELINSVIGKFNKATVAAMKMKHPELLRATIDLKFGITPQEGVEQ